MGSGLANGAAFNILTVNVGRKATIKPVLGPLPPFRCVMMPATYPTSPRRVHSRWKWDGMMTWTINGRVFEMMAVAEDEMVYLR